MYRGLSDAGDIYVDPVEYREAEANAPAADTAAAAVDGGGGSGPAAGASGANRSI